MKKIYTLIILLASFTSVFAQSGSHTDDTDENLLRAAVRGWHVRVGAGFNLGGTSPLPLPAEIRAIDGFNPGLHIALEGAMQKQFGATPWGIQLGVRLESKGMSTDATVKNYYMEAKEADGGEIKGAFTGHVKTSVNNRYLTFPILGVYKINERWSLSAGPYLSWMFDGSFSGEAYGKEIKNELGESIGVDAYIRDQNPTGEKTEVTSATYDFSGNLRKFHYGVQVGGEFKAYKHLSAFVNLQWGLNGIFPSDFSSVTFSLYPVYGTLGFNYLF